MIEKLKNILAKKNVENWKLNVYKEDSREFFFLEKNMDMNRRVVFEEYTLTIYKYLEGKKLSFVSFNIEPTMNEKEIEELLNNEINNLKYVENDYFPLIENNKGNFNNGKIVDFNDILKKIYDEIYIDYEDINFFINSSEIFIKNVEERVINSKGVELSSLNSIIQIDYVITYKGDEEVEINDFIEFSDYKEGFISNRIKDKILNAKSRSHCKNIVSINNVPVIINENDVKEFFEYYIQKCSADYIYKDYSNYKINDFVQKTSEKGDLINLNLISDMKNSTFLNNFDEDGVLFEDKNIINEGKLINIWGDSRYSYYLGIEPTGFAYNFEVKGGKYNNIDLRKSNYIEIMEFSDFQVDYITGDFGGEIRLARYFDGSSILAFSGGSISGNVKENESTFNFSKEVNQLNNFIGPKSLKLFNVNISF
ncbi:MAG: hypothetical protein PWP28_2262 [Oceanotoga sp.]|jgi:predicted Zn-dependent protease|uniref:metallopeptidase TldD-related protein n=1 Tax=Oceanotoga sp. TaxID=2108366 RepID=UPI00264DF7A7|nr:metallopeptidase TldD-related protein [Oceanotoga sp.]MDN5343382.1 hypothetical protein [Oceanotoga sp.]